MSIFCHKSTFLKPSPPPSLRSTQTLMTESEEISETSIFNSALMWPIGDFSAFIYCESFEYYTGLIIRRIGKITVLLFLSHNYSLNFDALCNPIATYVALFRPCRLLPIQYATLRHYVTAASSRILTQSFCHSTHGLSLADNASLIKL
jgi:hypothetical protein